MTAFQRKDKNGNIVKTKDGKTWWFKVYIKKQGKLQQILRGSWKTKSEALEEERLFLLKRDNPIRKNFDLIAKDYLKEIESTKKASTSESYIRNYNKHIKPFFNDYDLNDIDIPLVREWRSELEKKGLSVAFANKIFGILRSILDFAMANYELSTNYAAVVGGFKEKSGTVKPDSKKIRYITIEDFNKFISVIDDPFWKSFFITALYTGCRKGELLALDWKSVDFDNNVIIIDKTLYTKLKGRYVINSTKNNLNRKIQMNKVLRETLLEHKKNCMQYKNFKDTWYVFGNSTYLPLTTIDRYKHKYFELSGVREITMHEFRHSCVSLLINEYVKQSNKNNVKIDSAKFFLVMSNRMGHSIEVMQKTYMHLFPTIQDEIVNLLDNL